MLRATSLFAAPLLLVAVPLGLQAAEYPIGSPQITAGMEVAAVYLQPIEMDPPGMMRAAAESDIHLEADIHATADYRAHLVRVLVPKVLAAATDHARRRKNA